MSFGLDTLLSILNPLARICLKNGIRLQELLPVLKKAFILEGKSILAKDQTPITVSKLSVMTGLQRPDVSKNLADDSVTSKPSAISQIVSVWLNSSRFLNQKGKPRVLSPEGRDSEFARLVGVVSKELNAYAVLFEMERAGLIEHTDDGVRLIGTAHLVSKNMAEGLKLLGLDINDLTDAVTDNLELEASRHLHLRLAYDNIPPEVIPEIQQKVLAMGHRFIREVQAVVAPYDRDISEEAKSEDLSKKDRSRLALTVFSFSENLE